MEYEVITLEEMTVMGLAARTNNKNPEMYSVIGGLWEQFYREVYTAIPNKTTGKALGIYTDYAGAEWDDYTVLVACAVDEVPAEINGATIRKIPAGRYAKFVIKGDVQQAVAAFWQSLWNMELPRSFVCDFEEYQDGDLEQTEIHIYIGLQNIEEAAV